MKGSSLLESLSQYYPQILAFTLTTLGSLVAYFVRPRVSLIWGVTSELTQRLPTNPEKTESVIINSEMFVVKNNGRAPAESVEITFNYEPDAFSIWPQRDYSRSINPENKMSIKLANIAPKEAVNIDMVCVNRDIPFLLGARDKTGLGKPARFVTIKAVPVWMTL